MTLAATPVKPTPEQKHRLTRSPLSKPSSRSTKVVADQSQLPPSAAAPCPTQRAQRALIAFSPAFWTRTLSSASWSPFREPGAACWLSIATLARSPADS